ncbi:MAG TPA: hypothetical protein VMI54_22065 [Polyangiaceae bacterium]|nr:hypothetical protein [Polyangiaceae bacterium]
MEVACLAAFVLSACCSAPPWTARVCAANGSGNCRAVDDDPHVHTVKSTAGVMDVPVPESSCNNGIGAVDVKVVDRDDLSVTVHCLVDQPTAGDGTMTLGPAPGASTPPPPPSPPAPPPGPGGGP